MERRILHRLPVMLLVHYRRIDSDVIWLVSAVGLVVIPTLLVTAGHIWLAIGIAGGTFALAGRMRIGARRRRERELSERIIERLYRGEPGRPALIH